MEIPDDRYYGIQTTRMLAVSGTAGFPVITYPDMHKALCQIKKACALANAEIGALAPEKARAITEACDRVIAGGFEKEFPLDMWQGGGYTCVNMNVNEVLGNLANEILTGHKGQDAVHPNTHVNMRSPQPPRFRRQHIWPRRPDLPPSSPKPKNLQRVLKPKPVNLRTLSKSAAPAGRMRSPSRSVRNYPVLPLS